MTKKTFMIWIPGKIVGIWDSSDEALKGFCDYVKQNEASLKSIRLTVYENTYKCGKEIETSLTGEELMEIVNEEDRC